MFSAFQRSCFVGRLGYHGKMLTQTQYRPWGYVLCLLEELFGREAGYHYKMLTQTQYRPWGYVLCLPEELFGREAGVSL
jgi:hypothetical protein